MTYKGFTGIVELDEEQGVLFGRVIGLRDVITFQGETVAEVVQAFHDSVDDYLGFCAERGEPPQKAYSGRPDVEKELRMDVSRLVLKPGEGRSVWLGGMGVDFKVSGADTGGAFAVVEHPIEPGRLVLPHVHLHEDEYSYVLEGTVGARVGDHEVVAGPGSYLIKPRGLMHTFWNPGPEPARLLEVIAPAGFEAYFAELAEAGDPDRRQALATKYGVTYSTDWVAELTSRYNLTLLGH